MLRTISALTILATLLVEATAHGMSFPPGGTDFGLSLDLTFTAQGRADLSLSLPSKTRGAEPNPRRSESLAIIVNKSNPIESLSFAELRKVFLGERSHWSNGRRIIVVMREPGQPERTAVLRLIYRMGEIDFKHYFLHALFTGEVPSTPKELATATNVRKFISYVPGAIGYVRADEVDGSVKVIRVDGLAPDDPGYKIKWPTDQ